MRRRGGYAWCQRAADTHQWLGLTDDSDPTPAQTYQCRADPDVITVWLTTPGMYGHDPAVTVADVLEVAGQFDGTDVIAYPALQDLLIEAQDAGVWGVPDHRVNVHYVIDRDEQFDGFLLVTRPQANTGRGLASGLLSDHDLADTHLTGVEAATDVLVNAATVVNASIAGRVPATAPAPQTITQSMQMRGEEAVYRIGASGRFHPSLYPADPVDETQLPPAASRTAGRPFPPWGSLDPTAPRSEPPSGPTDPAPVRRR